MGGAGDPVTINQPQKAPLRMRATRGTGAVRDGVVGNRSTMSSPTARMATTIPATRTWRARSTAAGAIIDRSPATTPRENAISTVASTEVLRKSTSVSYAYRDAPARGGG